MQEFKKFSIDYQNQQVFVEYLTFYVGTIRSLSFLPFFTISAKIFMCLRLLDVICVCNVIAAIQIKISRSRNGT